MNNDNYFVLSIVANMCQLMDFQLNITQLSNDDLMRHLLQQDRVLDEQTNLYLKKIIDQNEEIKSILNELLQSMSK